MADTLKKSAEIDDDALPDPHTLAKMDWFDKIIERIQSKDSTRFESVIVGFLFFILGIGLCFGGTSYVKLVFAFICIFALDLLIINLILAIFNVDYDGAAGITLTVLCTIISIPVGHKLSKMLDQYIFSFFTGLLFYITVNLIVSIIDAEVVYDIKAILEFFALVIGLYVGQKSNQMFKVTMTAILGSMISCFSLAIALQAYPVQVSENHAGFWGQMAAIIVLSVCGWLF